MIEAKSLSHLIAIWWNSRGGQTVPPIWGMAYVVYFIANINIICLQYIGSWLTLSVLHSTYS